MAHFLQLHAIKPQDVSKWGTRVRATKSNFPSLVGMSFYKLVMEPKAVREPHWHANADELGYCLKGSLLVSIYGTSDLREVFLVAEGESFFIPSGAFHSIENMSDQPSEIILQFSDEEPEDFELSNVLGFFSNAVLGNTWNVFDKHFQDLQRNTKKCFLAGLDQSSPISKENRYDTLYRFALEASPAIIDVKGGTARLARKNVWPILRRQALYSLRVNGNGMREPHWHPETSELGYVALGRARMLIVSPSGNVDTYILEQGDIYFIPKAYPHHIENLNDSELHMLIFFDQPMPEDIGFTGSIKSFSDDVLAASLNSKKEIFATLPTYYEDLFIVDKKNPVE